MASRSVATKTSSLFADGRFRRNPVGNPGARRHDAERCAAVAGMLHGIAEATPGLHLPLSHMILPPLFAARMTAYSSPWGPRQYPVKHPRLSSALPEANRLK